MSCAWPATGATQDRSKQRAARIPPTAASRAGLAITDDFGAGAIEARGEASEAGGGRPRGGSPVTAAAIAALQAGADMLMIAAPEDQDGVTDALIEALGTGDISEDRLDEAVGRVLVLKQQLGLSAGDS